MADRRGDPSVAFSFLPISVSRHRSSSTPSGRRWQRSHLPDSGTWSASAQGRLFLILLQRWVDQSNRPAISDLTSNQRCLPPRLLPSPADPFDHFLLLQ